MFASTVSSLFSSYLIEEIAKDSSFPFHSEAQRRAVVSSNDTTV